MNTQVTSTSLDATAIGDAMRSKALGVAAKTGKALDDIVIRAANAKHEFSLAPISLRAAIRSNMTEAEIDELPMPGERWKDDKGNLSNNPDICQWKDPTKPDGKPKEISFYVVWADNTPEGQVVVRELDWCSRAASENMRTDDIPADWMKRYASNPTDLKKRKKYLEGRRATVRKAYKDAVRLDWQVTLVNGLDGCGCEVGEGDDNTVTVFNAKKPRGEWKVYSVGAFLKLKPVLAAKAGGSYAALEATAERAPKQPDPAKGPVKLAANDIKTVAIADNVAVAFDTWLDKCMSDKGGSEYAALLKHLTHAGGATSAATLNGIRTKLNTLFTIDALAVIAEREEQKAA